MQTLFCPTAGAPSFETPQESGGQFCKGQACWRACCGGRGRRTQGVDEVGIGTGKVMDEGVAALLLTFVLRDTRG